MAVTPKILGQLNPSATTLTDLYTVPASTKTTSTTIYVCNRSSTQTSFRIALAKAGAADDLKQYIYYDETIPGNLSFAATVGVGLEPTDVVRVYATLATLSFNMTGIEEV
jgi:hypothetical protein